MNERVVSVSWVNQRLGDPSVRVVDVRDPWEFEGIGHVPGAVNIPFEEFRAPSAGAAEAGMLPGAAVFADLVGAAGIDGDDELVAYDDDHGVFAARFLVTAELYGHDPEKLHLLDGDFSAWQREGTGSDVSADAAPTTYPAAFNSAGPLVEIDTVRAAIDDPETVVVDVREPHEYDAGHLPNAVQLDWRTLVDEETRGLRPEDELRAVLAEHGITPDRRVLLYCNTARRISHTYVVLRALGYEHVDFYEGSLTEWEAVGEELAE